VSDSLNHIREINFNGIKIGGENSFPILNPVYVLNIPVCNLNDNFEISKSYYGIEDLSKILEIADKSDCDIIGLRFNISEVEEISYAADMIKSILPSISKPLMVSGSGSDETDRILLPEIIECIDRRIIVNGANENTYKDIIPSAVRGNHIVVLKSPIDINLAKELNILSTELGQSLDNILIDTDIGGLGYGLEYGYSIMEKIKLEGLKGDKYLNMPIISFACSESLKTKEAKTELSDKNWGDLDIRAKYFELTSASAVWACGANVIVMNYPPDITVMKGLVQ